jgi:hypothetical protein
MPHLKHNQLVIACTEINVYIANSLWYIVYNGAYMWIKYRQMSLG